MNDPKGHVCPECGAPRGADNTPSCACAERAADAHIENRTAEAAAAEDFDPLRIRPYVELTPETPASSSSPEDPAATYPAAEATMPMPAVPQNDWPDEASTAAMAAVPQQPLGSPPHPAHPAEDEPPSGSGNRPRVLLLGVAGAVVAVLAAGGLAGGMFTYDKPSRDSTSAQDVRESVPAATTSAASPTPSGSPTSSKSASPTPTPSRSASPTASPPRAAPSPTPSRPAAPTQAPTTAQATGTITPAPGDDEESAPILRPGDNGDEVLELQLRLRQLALYLNDTDGVYDDNVENAVTTYQTTRGIDANELGVYDRTTRERLESETTEP
ncbi:peptidoglycan-binding protein [Streptomyces sp. ADMS]|uniref:peptidoglycan-binding domain-containing protein n=1 Tax=Streptomyces sp. ADMS TaxID=3071415 RepID=UPI00296FD46F|nr:peptidoglycan-binding protein [Streptomyces sp. ADMS]MDW4906147.1 peptidoglycan-binding protein [Streptomyces sp. ADMS]